MSTAEARDWIRCMQIALREYGFAVATNGLWDDQTRRAAFQYHHGLDVEYPAVGIGTLWVRPALMRHYAAVLRCLGTQYATEQGLAAAEQLIIDVEATGELEREAAATRSKGLPWAWVIAVAAAAGVVGVTVWLWKGKRR